MAKKDARKSSISGAQLKKDILLQLEKVLQKHKVADYKLEPRLPQVLIQPDLLIVPEIGKLIAVEFAHINPNKTLWGFSLERIEQLFELKLTLSKETICVLVIIEDVDRNRPQQTLNEYMFLRNNRNLQPDDATELLKRFYDNVLIIRLEDDKYDLNISQLIGELLETKARDELFYLWEMEKRARHISFETILNKKLVKKVLENSYKERTYRKPESKDNTDLFEIFRKRLTNLDLYSSYKVMENPKVSNIKEFFLNSGFSYYFTFDYVMFPIMFDKDFYQNYWNHFDLLRLFDFEGAFIKLLRGSNRSFQQIGMLQRIATYARFISYKPDAETKRIRLVNQTPNLLLVLDGNLLGPTYDPQRYLRYMISSGWTPIYLQDFSEQALLPNRYGK